MNTGRIKLLIAGIVVLALAGALAMLLSQRPVAPAAVFFSLDGKKIALDSLRGKVVLVNFWATSCPGCIKEMPELVRTHRKYHSLGLETVAVAMSYDPPAYVRQFAGRNGLPFIVALDADGAAALAFGDVRVTPTTFVVDRRGQIIQQYVGEPDFAKLRALIEGALHST